MRDMEASGWVDERRAGVGRIRYFLPPFQGSALLVRYLGFDRSGSTLGDIPAAAARLQFFGVSPDDPAQRLNVTPTLESRFPEEQSFRCHNQIVALHIEHPEAERLAEELSAHTDESITEAVVKALRERLMREKRRVLTPSFREELLAIGDRCAALPDLDTRSPDEILGYDEHGVPR